MFNVGPLELLVILVIALVVFGPQRLPEIGRAIGKSLREFRKVSTDLREELERDLSMEDEPPSRGPPSRGASPEPPSPRESAPGSTGETP